MDPGPSSPDLHACSVEPPARAPEPLALAPKPLALASELARASELLALAPEPLARASELLALASEPLARASKPIALTLELPTASSREPSDPAAPSFILRSCLSGNPSSSLPEDGRQSMLVA